MNNSILQLASASSNASQFDRLFFALLSLSALVIGTIALLIVVFAIRYRRGHTVNRQLDRRHARRLEYLWIVIPLLLFVGFFVWGAVLFVDEQSPPTDALTIYGVGKQWMWKFEHVGGQREIDALHVPLGQAVRVVLASQDVIHSFYVPAFRVKQDAVPGYLTSIWFTATRAGDYHLFCAEYCGTQHSAMIGRVVVLPPAQYQSWLDNNASNGSMASRGRELYAKLGCAQCHSERSAVAAPPLRGLYDREVALNDGTRVRADERYLRDAILNPNAEVTAGYRPIMPSYAAQIDEAQTFRLIAYLKALGHAQIEPTATATEENNP